METFAKPVRKPKEDKNKPLKQNQYSKYELNEFGANILQEVDRDSPIKFRRNDIKYKVKEKIDKIFWEPQYEKDTMSVNWGAGKKSIQSQMTEGGADE